MRYLLLTVSVLAWALWLGATIAVFVFGLYFSKYLPRDTFHLAANAMFAVFARYQVVLAGVAVISAGLSFVTYPSRWTLGPLACFIASLLLAVIFGFALLPMMEGLRRQGMGETKEFMQLHGQSMATTALQAVVLLVAGVLMVVGTSRRPRAVYTVEERALATA